MKADENAVCSHVDLVIEKGLARLVLQRAEVGNRFNLTMMREFVHALERVNQASVDVLVITAAGEDFSLGRDQTEVLPEGLTPRNSLELIVEANSQLTAISGITVVAAQGRAFGFACGLVVQADLAFAADTASFSFNEVRHGFAPSIVMTYLGDAIGNRRALDLVVTGRPVAATEAERYGLLSRVVARDDLVAVTESTVGSLQNHNADVLRECKSYLREIRAIDPKACGRYALDRMTRTLPV